jgi:hypothetical protein
MEFAEKSLVCGEIVVMPRLEHVDETLEYGRSEAMSIKEPIATA